MRTLKTKIRNRLAKIDETWVVTLVIGTAVMLATLAVILSLHHSFPNLF